MSRSGPSGPVAPRPAVRSRRCIGRSGAISLKWLGKSRGVPSAFSMAGRASPTMPPSFSTATMSTAPWSAAPASKPPISSASSRPTHRLGAVATTRHPRYTAHPDRGPRNHTRMSAVLLVIHLLIAIALIVTVLLQRSEGGALGIGGGGAGALFSSRGTANVLTRSTAVLAVAFFITSISLTILARQSSHSGSVFDRVPPSGTQPGAPGAPGGGSVL